jgi:outer membrane protein assembly factor BamB
MKKTGTVSLVLPLTLLTLALCAALPAVADWPTWRGPRATGTQPEGSPPVEWSEATHVRWKVPLPGAGLASPIVWQDRVFLLTAIPTSRRVTTPVAVDARRREVFGTLGPETVHRFVVLALDRADGSVVWQRTAIEAVPVDTTHGDATWASASPVTDGEVLIAHFGSAGVFAFTLDGDRLWSKDLGDMRTRNGFGEGSSPAIHGETVVINWDHEDDSFVVALDRRTGEEKWRRAREEPTSWSTPIIVEVEGQPQVVISATNRVRGYDLASGEELWSVGGMTPNVVPSPVHHDGVVYATSGFRGNALLALRLAAARGDLEATAENPSEGENAVLWSWDRNTPYVPSPLFHEGNLYFLKSNNGILSAHNAASGAALYTERLEGVQGVYASPVAADGRIYVVGRNGVTAVVRHGETFEVLATNTLEDRFDASPAIAGDALYLRGRKFLYCLARDPEPGEGASGAASTTPAETAP